MRTRSISPRLKINIDTNQPGHRHAHAAAGDGVHGERRNKKQRRPNPLKEKERRASPTPATTGHAHRGRLVIQRQHGCEPCGCAARAYFPPAGKIAGQKQPGRPNRDRLQRSQTFAARAGQEKQISRGAPARPRAANSWKCRLSKSTRDRPAMPSVDDGSSRNARAGCRAGSAGSRHSKTNGGQHVRSAEATVSPLMPRRRHNSATRCAAVDARAGGHGSPHRGSDDHRGFSIRELRGRKQGHRLQGGAV